MDIKDIFPYEQPIPLCDDISEQLDTRRKKFQADRGLLEGESVPIDIENITELPDGKIRIDINGAHFECFLHKGSTEKMYVIFNAARDITDPHAIRYNRWSYYAFCGYTWVSIEDPMFFDFSDVKCGWFYGTPDKNYRAYTAYLIGKICDFLNVKNDRVCFFGSSAGGTAAIHTAALFGNGVALSLNGQLNFEYDHGDVVNYITITGLDLHEKDKYDRNDLVKIMTDAGNKVKFILMENCRSKWDIEDHLKYLCDKTGISPVYGISQFGNIVTWLYDAPPVLAKTAHTAFENKNIFYAVDFLAGLVRGGEDLEKYKPLYLLFNEFWYDIYNPPTRNIRVRDGENLSPREMIAGLNWNRSQRQKLQEKLKKIKEIIESTK